MRWNVLTQIETPCAPSPFWSGIMLLQTPNKGTSHTHVVVVKEGSTQTNVVGECKRLLGCNYKLLQTMSRPPTMLTPQWMQTRKPTKQHVSFLDESIIRFVLWHIYVWMIGFALSTWQLTTANNLRILSWLGFLNVFQPHNIIKQLGDGVFSKKEVAIKIILNL